MPESAHRHRVFAAVYAVLAALGERTGLDRWRDRTLAPAYGRLLVLGLGPGHDLTHLPPAVTDVVAVEPDPAMRRRALRRLRAAPVPVRVVSAVGERLPLPDASVDSVLTALVLCSVDDPPGVLAELRRVLRPDGVLLVLEHVRAPAGTRLARMQDRAERPWSRVSGGCHPNRRTGEALAAAGFDTTRVRAVRLPGIFLVAPHVAGLARPVSAGPSGGTSDG